MFGMTLEQFRRITKNMPCETKILARNRDEIYLDQVDVVGGEEPTEKVKGDFPVSYHESIEDVYGGDGDLMGDTQTIKHAIIFCDCD